MKRISIVSLVSGALIGVSGLADPVTNSVIIEGSLNVMSNLTVGGSAGFDADVTAYSLTVSGPVTLNGPLNVDVGNVYTNYLGGSLTILGLSVQEGFNCLASGCYSHVEGMGGISIGDCSHVEGEYGTADVSAWAAHVEGSCNYAYGYATHAEGFGTAASGDFSHVEGLGSCAIGLASHAEGSSTYAGGYVSHAAGENACATNDYTFVWSDGTLFYSTVPHQFSAYARNGFRFAGGTICGNGAGLTNLAGTSIAAGSIGAGALATGAVQSVAIAAGAVGSTHLVGGSVTADKLAAGSVGTNTAVLAQWNSWGDARYVSAAGSSELVLTEPGRIVAGFLLNKTNISLCAYGASQFGCNEGSQCIQGYAIGAVQRGYNSGSQTIEDGAFGAVQQGQNFGFQSLDFYAIGSVQRGNNIGVQTIESDAYGASQEGENDGVQTIGVQSIGASQRGYNMGEQVVCWYALGASQFGVNVGKQTISNEAYGASQNGWNDGTQTIGPNAYGAEQRGFVALYAYATNSGIGSVQLINLTNSQLAVVTGHASLGLGACWVTNDQSIVAGDGLASRGRGSVTALKFFGDGAGLTGLDLSAYAGDNLTWDPVGKTLNAAAAYGDSNAVAAVMLSQPSLADGDDDTRWSGTADGLVPATARTSLGLGSSATNDASAFAPADLSSYASGTVVYSNGHFHAAVQLTSGDVTNAVLTAWQNLDTDKADDLTTAGATMAGDFDMNSQRVKNLPTPQADGDAVSKAYLRQVLSCLPPQGNLSMGAYTNGAPASFPLEF